MAELKTGYDDKAAMEQPDGESYAKSYGVFDARIKSVVPAKKGGEFEIRTSSNGKPHYTARYIVEYKNTSGEIKEKSVFIPCIGLWFPDITKMLLEATGFDTAEGRKALMEDTDAMVDSKIQIVIGARKKGEYGDRPTYKGYEVREYDGKIFIANEILSIHARGKAPALDMGAEDSLRKAFKDSGYALDGDPSNAEAKAAGFDATVKAEDLDF